MAEYIERTDAMNAVLVGDVDKDFPCMDIAARLHDIPAADVRPVVRGRWIDRDDDYYGWNMWACSACGEEFVLTEGTPDMNDYHFCPNCGALMDKDGDQNA